MITVSIPVWRTPPEQISRAVSSVLANDAVERVVLTGDGAPVPPASDDPRVVSWHIRCNRGRYFVDDVVSRATRTSWFTTHDADDWSDPGRLDAMANTGADITYTARTTGHTAGPRSNRPVRRRPRTPVDVIWGVMALYRTDIAAGLFHPGYRVSWDAIIDNIGYRYSYHRPTDRYLYHIEKQPGSLTTGSTTGIGSEYRTTVTGPQRRLWDAMADAGTLANVKSLITATTHPTLAIHRDEEVARLRALL